MPGSFDLERFVKAQEGSYAQVYSELLSGRKRTHWMWFIFPQIAGLGSRPMAVHFAISGLDEARAYLAHPLLGQRLRECASLVNAVENREVDAIFGYPDDLKFHSSMTLFAQTTLNNTVFHQALDRYFNGRLDQATMDRL